MLLTVPIPKERQYVSDLGKVQNRSAAIVVIESDEGVTGYGEALGAPLVMKALIERQLKPLLVGEDPTRTTYLWEKMYNVARLGLSLYYGRSMPEGGVPGDKMRAMSGIDIALWDLAGKASGVPSHKLMGGAVRDRIRAYASGGHGALGQIGDQLRGYVEKGYTACKMRVGGKDHPRIVLGSAARIKEAREAIGADIELTLDAHGSTSVTEAIRLAKAVEEYNVAWYEEPVIFHNLPGMAEVRRATSIPIATGENLCTRFAFRDLALARAADIWQPDVAIAGGITEVLRIAALASALEFQLAPHAGGGGSAYLVAANLQLAAALPNYSIFELTQNYNPLLRELITTKIEVEKDGCIPIPQGPGLGIEIVPDAERRFPFQDTAERVAMV